MMGADPFTSPKDLLVALSFWGLAFLLNDERLQDERWLWLRTTTLVILIVSLGLECRLDVAQCVD